MFALNGSTPYGNEICGSHRSARAISKVPAGLRRGSKFLEREDDLRMHEGERKSSIHARLALLSSVTPNYHEDRRRVSLGEDERRHSIRRSGDYLIPHLAADEWSNDFRSDRLESSRRVAGHRCG